MNDSEFLTILIAIIGVVAVPLVKMYLDLRKERNESEKDRELIKALTEYVSAQREHLKTLQAQVRDDLHLKESQLALQKERLEWDQLVAAAKTLGWVLEKSGLLEELKNQD